MNKYAPIVIFVYNRPWHTEQVLKSLKQCDFSGESVLFIYSDGPKNPDDNCETVKINEVRKVIRSEQWCREVNIIESGTNSGLAKSIISGVTEIVEKYEKIIVLEDDILVSKGFLKYMNDALNFYENENRVMHISSYMYPHKKELPKTFFFEVPYPGGGWATWQRAWKYFKDDAEWFYNHFEETRQWNLFNKFGGKFLQKQLKSNVDGELKTWFIKWHASMILNKGLTLYPGKSLTNNIGFDGSGSHCTTINKFDVDELAEYINITPEKIKVNKKAKHIIIRFYQGRYYFIKKILIDISPDFLKSVLKHFILNGKTKK